MVFLVSEIELTAVFVFFLTELTALWFSLTDEIVLAAVWVFSFFL